MGELCLNCGGKNIENGIRIGHQTESGGLGPSYQNKRIPFIIGAEQMFCNLCLDCGELTRIYVKETKRDWFKK
jgi:hypothetical protein